MKQAFTLIELLVVVLIIGILAAIALPQYERAVMRTRHQQAVAFGDLCIKAQKVYYLEHGTYTLNFDEFSISIPTPTKTLGRNTVYYDWGWCQLRNNAGIVDLNCYPNNSPRYQINFNGNIRSCFGGQDLPTFNAVCQIETGKINPDTKHATAGWWAWDY